ncbi:N-acetylmuramoyl-L-alanine amidase [Candidatus Sumerlaeota bacterium]|nr:N-acetylmuramoyl-L-alanine amidase [Candidatus Sumerlaeota bacterium]
MFRVQSKIFLIALGGLIMLGCAMNQRTHQLSPLAGKVICIDPGHGGTASFDTYRVGPTGEREEWINLRVGLLLKDMLEEKGARVVMTREEDVRVGLKDRALLAVKNKADVFLSLHHNATADRTVNFPIVYYHGNASENQASVQLGLCVARSLRKALFEDKTTATLVSDHTIFPGSGTAVLRHSYGIPGVIGEASFFSNPEEEQRLKNKQYNRKEAEAYVEALERFFSLPPLPIKKKYSIVKLPGFPVLQEADRMNKIALRWLQDFKDGKRLLRNPTPESIQKAYNLFTRSARSFPDSWVARECHLYRAQLLEKMGRQKEAEQEYRRVKEYYVSVESDQSQ